MDDFLETKGKAAFLYLMDDLRFGSGGRAKMRGWTPRRSARGFSCACDPFAPLLWRWRLPFGLDEPERIVRRCLPHLAPLKSAFAEMKRDDRRPKTLLCGDKSRKKREFCEECPCAGQEPVFDGDLCAALFGNSSIHSLSVAALSLFCAQWARDHASYPGMERLVSFKRGRVSALERALECLPNDRSISRREILLEWGLDFLDWKNLSECLDEMIGPHPAKSIRISGDRRKFSSGWEQKWDAFYNRLPVMEDDDGPMRGCLNLDTGLYPEMIAAFRSAAAKKLDGRASPFELVKVSYPDGMPEREALLEDMRIILGKYGMAEHPAMWAVSRRKGEAYALRMCVCRVDRFTGKIPDGVVIELDLRPNGSSRRVNADGCRQAAVAALNERHGYGQGGTTHDGNGRRIVPATPERHNAWTS